MLACKNSGYEVLDHFAEVSKIVEAGATSKPIIDYKLTRYACYLIVQNRDPPLHEFSIREKEQPD